MAYKRTSLMSSYPTRYNRPSAMAGPGYVSAHDDLGETLTMPSAGDLGVGRLQAAINRVVLGARNEPDAISVGGEIMPSFIRDVARAAPFVPLPINGVADARTLAASKSAGLIAGASTVEVSNAAFTEKLEAFADSRGYPAGPIVVAPGIIGQIPVLNKLPIKTAAIVLGGGALLLGFILWRRRSP